MACRLILDAALPKLSVATEFAPLSRGQANIKALAFCRRHEPAAAGAGALIFVSSITFASLGLAEPLLRALEKERFLQPTPIQASAIPPLLAGREGLGDRAAAYLCERFACQAPVSDAGALRALLG